jgi:hypothetical protein
MGGGFFIGSTSRWADGLEPPLSASPREANPTTRRFLQRCDRVRPSLGTTHEATGFCYFARRRGGGVAVRGARAKYSTPAAKLIFTPPCKLVT